MADYYPLISRAVAGLEQSTGDNRRELYARARAALVEQLLSVTPALSESDITRERLALEEAIRKVEAEAMRRPPPAPAAPREPVPGPSAAPAEPPSLSDEGMRDYREVMAEADELGAAAKEPDAAKSAREFHDAAPGGGVFEPERVEPRLEADDLRDRLAERPGSDEPVGGERPSSWPPPPHEEGTEESFSGPPRSYRGLIKAAIAAAVLIAIALIGYWQRDNVASLATLFRSAPAPASREAAPVRPKIADRIPSSQQDAAQRPGGGPAVAQKVVLYEEDPNDPQGKRFVGSVLWRTETVSPGPGLAPELAVRADLDIPERKMRMTWSLRRNTDKALPASHTIEIMFTLPADFPEGALANVPGILMKASEDTRGVPLAGLAVKVTNGFFLVGLSAVDVDVQRNVQLLKERSWFDLPLVYTSGKRAILAIEKGAPGERAFEDAFRAWGQ